MALNLAFSAVSLLFAQVWQLVESPTHQNLARLDMVSGENGRAISYDGLILKYDGSRWGIEDSLSQIVARFEQSGDSATADAGIWGDFYTVRMLDEHRGWIAVNEVDYRSYRLLEFDGNGWKPAKANLPIKIRALDFLTPNSGIAAGEGGAFALSGDQLKMLTLPLSLDFRAVKMLSPEQFYIIGENGAILEYRNGWRTLENPLPNMLRDMDFVSPDEGWFVGNQGTILHFANQNIEIQESPTLENIWAIDMLSPEHGFAVGTAGVILEYENGVWRLVESGTEADLHDIEMIDETDGWIVGGRGVILQFGAPGNRANGVTQPDFLFRDQVYLGTRHLMDLIDDVHGVTVADFNNDDHIDIYLTCERSLNHLLLNDGSGYFRDFTIESGTGGDIESRKGKQKYETGAIAADFDRDGDTDLLLCGKRGTTQLLKNQGDANFEDVTASVNLPQNLNISAGVLADFDADGYPDIALVDEFSGLRIFQNRKYLRFEETPVTGPDLPKTGIRAIAAADFNGDHRTDLLLFYQQTTPVFLQNHPETGWQIADGIFKNVHVSQFVNSATVADFNNDGRNDLFLCTENGEDQLLIADGQNRAFTDKSAEWQVIRDGRSYTAIAKDFDLDGDVDLFVSRFGADFLYLSESTSRFAEVAERRVYSKAGYLSGFNTGAAAADIDGDNDYDLVVGNRDFWSSLLENTGAESAFVRILPSGTQDARETPGAKIWVWPAGAAQTDSNLLAFREIVLSNGYFSQDQPGFICATGAATAVDVRVRFLNGDEFFYENIAPGTTLRIVQGNNLTRLIYSAGRTTLQFLHIPYIPFELLKLLFFIALLVVTVRFIEKRYRWRPTHTVIYVLGIIALYAILTIALPRDSGLLYHTLPFGMILFALLALVTVNEPIKKNAKRQAMIQKTLQDAGASLSNTGVTNAAINIVGDAVQVIFPFAFVAIYQYQHDGNFFIQKFSSGAAPPFKKRFHLERGQVSQLANADGELRPVGLEMWLQLAHPAAGQIPPDAGLVFRPVVKEDRVKAVFFAGLPVGENSPQIDAETQSMIDFLMLQLANTLNNIRIYREASEREKLAAIGSFSSGILHNLKNPVDGLRMMIEALYYDMPKHDPRFDYVNELYQGVLHLKNTLLHSFEFVTQSEARPENVDVHTIIREITGHFSAMSYQPVDLQFASENIAVKGNAQRLKVALENIISNALEASGVEKTVRIRSEFHPRDASLRIDVIDSGEGIPVEQIDKIFDIFYSTRGKSRGLGLAITREIIKRHGGHIDVQSSAGNGTRMSIILPATVNVQEVADEPRIDR